MKQNTGHHRDVYWERHHWGLALTYWPTGSAYPVRRKYVGNGSDRVTVRESVAEMLRDLRDN